MAPIRWRSDQELVWTYRQSVGDPLQRLSAGGGGFFTEIGRSSARSPTPLGFGPMGVLLPNSGLIVEVPESESVVGHHRDALDINARGGVPAHVTVLYPFLPPHLIDDVVLDRL